jgi:hypothetical protein
MINVYTISVSAKVVYLQSNWDFPKSNLVHRTMDILVSTIAAHPAVAIVAIGGRKQQAISTGNRARKYFL